MDEKEQHKIFQLLLDTMKVNGYSIQEAMTSSGAFFMSLLQNMGVPPDVVKEMLDALFDQYAKEFPKK